MIGKITSFIVLFIVAFGLSACEKSQHKISGYVEGEYVYVSPSSGGILQAVAVKEGDEVHLGQALFSLDLTRLKAERDVAATALQQADFRLQDAMKGLRSEEIIVLEKKKEQASAVLQDAEIRLQRSRSLVKGGYVTQAQLDADQARHDEATAKVDEAEAQLKTALLGSRDDVVAAARAEVEAAKLRLVQADKLLAEAAPVPPAAGRVEEVYYRIGEFVAAGAPVVSILPPENIKVRFFVSQKMLPQMQPGKAVSFMCDGCASTLPGKISFVSSAAEYTPPVIYSEGSRDKFVFMVEARPDAFDPGLRPGLPVDIRIETP